MREYEKEYKKKYLKYKKKYLEAKNIQSGGDGCAYTKGVYYISDYQPTEIISNMSSERSTRLFKKFKTDVSIQDINNKIKAIADYCKNRYDVNNIEFQLQTLFISLGPEIIKMYDINDVFEKRKSEKYILPPDFKWKEYSDAICEYMESTVVPNMKQEQLFIVCLMLVLSEHKSLTPIDIKIYVDRAKNENLIKDIKIEDGKIDVGAIMYVIGIIQKESAEKISSLSKTAKMSNIYLKEAKHKIGVGSHTESGAKCDNPCRVISGKSGKMCACQVMNPQTFEKVTAKCNNNACIF